MIDPWNADGQPNGPDAQPSKQPIPHFWLVAFAIVGVLGVLAWSTFHNINQDYRAHKKENAIETYRRALEAQKLSND